MRRILIYINRLLIKAKRRSILSTHNNIKKVPQTLCKWITQKTKTIYRHFYTQVCQKIIHSLKKKRNGPDACMMHFEKLWCFPMSQSSLNWVDKAMESNWHRGTWVLVHRKKEGKREKLDCNKACELLNAVSVRSHF